MMNKIKNAAAVMVLSALSFGTFAADNLASPAADNLASPAADNLASPAADTHVATGISRASDVEAGSNIAPGTQSTGQSMNDAFDVHKLVAGEWS